MEAELPNIVVSTLGGLTEALTPESMRHILDNNKTVYVYVGTGTPKGELGTSNYMWVSYCSRCESWSFYFMLQQVASKSPAHMEPLVLPCGNRADKVTDELGNRICKRQEKITYNCIRFDNDEHMTQFNDWLASLS